MTGILFVCHGNICRSPMAEFVLKQMAAERGLAERLETASAATTDEELGNGVYPPVRRLLKAHGIDCSGKTARLLTAGDYDRWDLLIGMDRENMADMRRLFRGDPKGKLRLLLGPREVPDPWYTRDFEACWRDVREGCGKLLEELFPGR